MQLVALAKNPIPGGAAPGLLDVGGGVKLRYVCWSATRGPRRGTVCLFGGRGEFIEKYFEVVADLRRRGFAVATMDWRGQGGSTRLCSNPRKGHVRSFADYDARSEALHEGHRPSRLSAAVFRPRAFDGRQHPACATPASPARGSSA